MPSLMQRALKQARAVGAGTKWPPMISRPWASPTPTVWPSMRTVFWAFSAPMWEWLTTV